MSRGALRSPSILSSPSAFPHCLTHMTHHSLWNGQLCARNIPGHSGTNTCNKSHSGMQKCESASWFSSWLFQQKHSLQSRRRDKGFPSQWKCANLAQALPRPLLPLRAHGDALTHHRLPLGTCHGAEQHLVLGAEGTTSLVPSAHPAPLRQRWSRPTVLGSCCGPARLTAAPGCALGPMQSC